MHDKILVKRIPAELSAGGIALPPSQQSSLRTEYGEVMAVGPGRKTEAGNLLPMTLKRGDKVLFMKGSGFPIDGGDFLVMHEADVFGLVE
jgi:chaperonin GroES